MSWINQHIAQLSLAVNAVTAVVWLVYLQLLLAGFRRQRRPMLLISRGGGSGLEARCFLSNMSAEPVYVLDVVADMRRGEQEASGSVADRTELAAGDLSTPAAATNQGPLASGDFLDIGSFRDLWRRVWGPDDALPSQGDEIRLTVAFASGHSALICAAERCYNVHAGDGVQAEMRPVGIMARQIRNRAGRRAIRRRLEATLD